MTDTTGPTYRSHTQADAEAIDVRQPEDDDGVFEVRMPIATTGEVRNEGDEPLSRDELSGMARQIDERSVGVFLDHGGTDLGGMERYSAVEKVGEWTDAELSEREADDTNALEATARLMDPETLPNGVSDLRAALGSLKEQVQRGFSLSASIGWRDDDGYPGGVDLMEASIVGIGADPRTTSEAPAGVVARAAVDAGADPDDLLEAVRHAVDGGGSRDLTEQQIELARDALDRFEDSQGDATLSDFDAWLFESDDDLDPDVSVAARAVVDEYVRATTPWQDPLSDTLRPWLSDQNGDSDDMSDDTDTDEEQDASDDAGEETRDAPEWADRMLDLLEDTNDTLQSVAEAVREDDEDDEEDGDDDTEENEGDHDDEDDEDDENAADEPDESQESDDDGEERDLSDEVADLREAVDDLRESGDFDRPEPEDEQDADDESGELTDDADTWRTIA